MGKTTGNLLIYSEPNFEGKEITLQESDHNLKKFKISSAIVQGNPWILYEKEQFQGLPVFLEEGRYDHIPGEDIHYLSAKLLSEDLGMPQIFLYSSTHFLGEVDWEKCSPLDVGMKSVSVGEGGIWGIRSKDDSVWMRMNDSNKLSPDEPSSGSSWARINGGLRQISVGSNSVWGINSSGSISVRVGIGKESPGGKEWVAVDGESIKHVSVSNKGHVWAVDDKDKIWYRKGACNENILGSGWKTIPGSLKQISVGYCGVWGLNSNQEVWYRINTATDPDNEGTGWAKVDGRFQQIYSGAKVILGLAGNRDIYYRSGFGISDMGTHWIRIEQEKESKIIFKHIECHIDSLWCVDTENHVWLKNQLREDMGKHNYIALNGDTPNFKAYSFPPKAASYKVNRGAWAIYSEANFEGKVMYQVNGEGFSNDPLQKVHPWKPWFQMAGSVRPVRGLNYRTLAIQATIDWDNADNVISELHFKNESGEYVRTDWDLTSGVSLGSTHKISLEKSSDVPQELSMTGESFEISPIDPFEFPLDYPLPELTTSTEFLQELHAGPFVLDKDLHSSRSLIKTTTCNLPNLVPPHTNCTLRIIVYRNQVSAPVAAEVRPGFKRNFEYGTESWTINGTYTGVDETHLKIELDFENIPQPRKVSKMLSGLGVLDM
eukprot:TRINITY_DN3493_c0_g1_i2.p1 TRINITY_DN3493_c0_g1~~TRINITY_DN3493_c0_g1_i2.p1  ORF type:complete len:659 (-),score=140.46 TRINITY_DN3493_c0_g1_i2:136-2112(-)